MTRDGQDLFGASIIDAIQTIALAFTVAPQFHESEQGVWVIKSPGNTPRRRKTYASYILPKNP